MRNKEFRSRIRASLLDLQTTIFSCLDRHLPSPIYPNPPFSAPVAGQGKRYTKERESFDDYTNSWHLCLTLRLQNMHTLGGCTNPALHCACILQLTSFDLIYFDHLWGSFTLFHIYISPFPPPPVRHHRHPLTTVAALPARETLAECETALVEAETGGPREERRDQSQRSRPRENAEEGGEYRGPGETSLEEAETEA